MTLHDLIYTESIELGGKRIVIQDTTHDNPVTVFDAPYADSTQIEEEGDPTHWYWEYTIGWIYAEGDALHIDIYEGC